jgi:hypothetical protein
MTRHDRREPTSPRDITRHTWLGGAVSTTGAAVAAMFARSLQGATPEDAVQWAAAELRKVYGA